MTSLSPLCTAQSLVNDYQRISSEVEPGVNPLIVITEMRNLAQEVRDVERIIRIVRFRVNMCEYRSRCTKYPELAEKQRKRGKAYQVWLYHLERMHDEG